MSGCIQFGPGRRCRDGMGAGGGAHRREGSVIFRWGPLATVGSRPITGRTRTWMGEKVRGGISASLVAILAVTLALSTDGAAAQDDAPQRIASSREYLASG